MARPAQASTGRPPPHRPGKRQPMRSFLLAMLLLAVAAFMLLGFADADSVQAVIDRFAGLLP